jgi:hypothetical protein
MQQDNLIKQRGNTIEAIQNLDNHQTNVIITMLFFAVP